MSAAIKKISPKPTRIRGATTGAHGLNA